MSNVTMPLCDIDKGTVCSIVSMNAGGSIRHRLLDLGFVEGASLQCVLKGQKGNICAYLIKNTVIALRRRDSSCILVTPFS